MGLKYSLKSDQNHICLDFIDAYWVIEEIKYINNNAIGILRCFPSREISKKEGCRYTGWETIKIGGPAFQYVKACLWEWEFMFPVEEVFPYGIPISEDEQKTAIYNWIKDYTGIPFEDVYEEEQ